MTALIGLREDKWFGVVLGIQVFRVSVVFVSRASAVVGVWRQSTAVSVRGCESWAQRNALKDGIESLLRGPAPLICAEPGAGRRRLLRFPQRLCMRSRRKAVPRHLGDNDGGSTGKPRSDPGTHAGEHKQ